MKHRYGPWALVVGGSSGIGAAVVRTAAEQGLNVLTVARRAELLDRQALELGAEYGVQVRPVAQDLAVAGAAERIIAAAEGLDVGLLVYNAAAEPRGYFGALPLDEHLTNITVNCTAPTVLSHHFGARMAARGRGGLALVSSMGALQGSTVFASYFAAKAYEWILAEGLWAEWAPRGVDVVAYLVGATSTENFHGRQHRAGAGADATLDAALDRLESPSTPTEVGRRLFEVLPHGPTAFSHPLDEQNAAAVLGTPRRAAVERMRRLTEQLTH